MTDPEQSEQQLRRVLGTMNDLQPPTDELFVQRAVIRGRARTSRRRSGLMGVAAALVLMAGGGGVWLLQNGLEMPASSSAGSAAEGAGPLYSPGVDARSDDTPAAEVPLVPPQRDPSWFVGPMTPEAAGDYVAGPSHVLPTGGAARFGAPLGVYDFVSRSSIIEYTAAALGEQGSAIATFARAEGLEAHARAVEIRTRG